MSARDEPSQLICFTHEGRRWTARQWSSTAGERFWKFAPKDQTDIPKWKEYRRAVAYFERACS